MLARHADSLFWAGRYLERAEDTARLLDVTYHGSLGATTGEVRRAWRRTLDILRLRKEFERRDEIADERGVPRFLVLDRANPGSIIASVATARENFRSVREQLSSEVWESVNRFHRQLQIRNLQGDLDGEPYALYDFVKNRCQTLAGVAAQTMPRDDGYRFMVIGWMLERAVMTTRLVSVRYPTLAHDSYDAWLLTLRSASGLEAYRKAFQASTNPVHVATFLLQSSTFPRSVLFCLQRAETSLERLDGRAPGRDNAGRLLGQVRSRLQYTDMAEAVAGDIIGSLDKLEEQIREVADALARQYFRAGDDATLHAQFVLPGEVPA
jgi:uncharacterized alpha-E superfamily protein